MLNIPVFKAGAWLERSSGVSEYSNSKPTTRMDMPRAAPLAVRFTGVRFGPIKAVISANAEFAKNTNGTAKTSDRRAILILLRTLIHYPLVSKSEQSLFRHDPCATVSTRLLYVRNIRGYSLIICGAIVPLSSFGFLCAFSGDDAKLAS